MAKDDYEKIIVKFGFNTFYTKQEVIDGLAELEIIEKKDSSNRLNNLLNKISNEIYFRKTYHKNNWRLKFISNKRPKLYQIVSWEQNF
ncbi:MAG: hypothetical protein ABIE36_00560 [Candidatus Diapherotrites archaeon]